MSYNPDEARDHMGKWTKGSAEVAHAVEKILSHSKVHGDAKIESAGTESIHTNANGQYSPARQALHQSIAKSFLEGRGTFAKPSVLFTAGGPASGKTETMHVGGVPKDAVNVNPDAVKEHLPEYQALKDAGRADIAARATHDESSAVAAQISKLAMLNKHNLVVDGTGDSGPGKFAGKINAARAHGYDVEVRYSTLPVGLAKRIEEHRSNKKGGASEGRKVPSWFLEDAHRNVSKIFHEEIRHLPVKVNVYDNRVKGRPKLIASKRQGDTHPRVHHRPLYNEFVAKGQG